jgi:energy-coupling factor transport system permease protein
MRSALAYAPRRGPLDDAGAIAATAFLMSFAFVAFAFSNPIVLAADLVAVAIAGLLAGARRALFAAARWGLTLAVVFVAVNAIASQRGETILLRGWDLPVLGQTDVSGEAVFEGAVLALRVLVVLVAFAVHSASVDPDRLLRLLRPIAGRSALTASLIARLVPVAAADHARLREATTLRGPAAAAVGRAAMARRLVAGSLDRAVDVAATLELRGYGSGAPRAVGSRDRPRRWLRFAVAATLVVAAAVVALAAGAGGGESYPVIEIAAGPGTLALSGLLPLAAVLPFLGVRRGA